MKTHFPMVPVEMAPRETDHSAQFRPLALIVDDEPIITETLTAILNRNGLAALPAANGREALELALLVPPEILISDISMPGMSGWELASEVTRHHPDCEVILFSGHAAATDKALNMRNGNFDFIALVKPVHPADLIDHVFERLNRRGSRLNGPQPRHSPSLYDFLSSVRRSPDAYASSWNVSMRQRIRPNYPA